MLYLFAKKKKHFVSSVKKEDNYSKDGYTLKEVVDTKDSINLPRKHLIVILPTTIVSSP